MVGKVTVERTERLRRLCKSIVDDPNSIDSDTKAKLQTATMKYAHTQYDDPERVLKRLYADDSDELGDLLRRAVEIVQQYDDDGGDGIAKADRGGTGHHNLAARVVEHALDMLDFHRRRLGIAKAANTAKDSIMDTQAELIGIMKDCGGPVALCKSIVDRGRSPCTEQELTAAISKAAAASGEREDVAFAKAFEQHEAVRRAIAIAKAAEAAFDVTIVRPGDETVTTVNDTESSEAYQQLEALASKFHAAATGKMTKEQAFARAFEANPTLAAKAHRRPVAPPGGAYPFPR